MRGDILTISKFVVRDVLRSEEIFSNDFIDFFFGLRGEQILCNIKVDYLLILLETLLQSASIALFDLIARYID